MKSSILSYVGWLLVLSAAGFYGYGVVHAIVLSWPKGGGTEDLPYHPFLATSIGSIQALLVTNLGILLGISMAAPDSSVARSLQLGPGKNADAAVNDAPVPPMELREKIQLWCLVIFMLALIACFVTWVVNDFSDKHNEVVPLIPESGRLFIGVVLAYLTAIIKTKNT